MSSFTWEVFRYIVELNFLTILFSIFLSFLLYLSQFKAFQINYSYFLKCTYLIIIFIFIIPIFNLSDNAHQFTKPFITKYAGNKMIDLKKSPTGEKTINILGIQLSKQRNLIKDKVIGQIDLITLSLTAIGIILFLFKMIYSILSIKRLIKKSYEIKKLKSVKIFSSDYIKGPFSLYYSFSHFIFLPNNMINDQKNTMIALKHEFQHIRQKDTYFSYILESLRVILFYNPFNQLLSLSISKLQELSCDETVIGQNKVSTQDYNRCLLKFANNQIKRDQGMVFDKLVGTAHLSASAKFLKRRFTTMSTTKKLSKTKTILISLISIILLTSMSYASKTLTKSNQITLKKAKELKAITNQKSEIPVYIDKKVLKYLNLGLGTQRGRNFIKSTLKRMKNFEPMINEKLSKFSLPRDLLAVPAHESGYQVYDNGIGAGIWAFVPNTARAFGLIVNDEIDERMDSEKLTTAAMKYFDLLKTIKEFKGNWHLSLLSYNAGQNHIRKSVTKYGTTDALKIIQLDKTLSKENREYLPRFMAWLIVFHNQYLLD